MKRKIKPQKPKKNRNPRSHVARDAWERHGGIHSDQMPNHKRSRQSAKAQARDMGDTDFD